MQDCLPSKQHNWILFGLFGSLSTVCWLIIFLLYFIGTNASNPPTRLTALVALSNLASSFSYFSLWPVFYEYSSISNFEQDEFLCRTSKSLVVYAWVSGVLYDVILCGEFLVRVFRPNFKRYIVPLWLINLAIQSAAVAYSISLAFFTESPIWNPIIGCTIESTGSPM